MTDHVPPAPWDCAASALVWWTRGGRTAAAATDGIGRRAFVVVGGFVRYRQTPVGAYQEVFGAVGLLAGRRPVGTVPFIAVDSEASVAAGRANWALPKVAAQFSGAFTRASAGAAAGEFADEGAGAFARARGAMTADGDGWRVRATPRAFGPRFPLPVRGTLVQRWPDGVVRAARLTGRARARLALVVVDTSPRGDLARWLRPGRHAGMLLDDFRFTLPTARPRTETG